MAKDGIPPEVGQLAGDVGGHERRDRAAPDCLGDGGQPGLGALGVEAAVAGRVPDDEDRVEARVGRDRVEGALQQSHVEDDQAGRVERVLRGPEAGQHVGQGRLGRGAEVGDLEPGVLGEVGEQAAGAPEAVSIATRRPSGSRPLASSAEVSTSSSRLPTRTTPFCRKTASTTRSSTARAPVWAVAERAPAGEPPTLSTTSGLPSRSARIGDGEEALRVTDALQQGADDGRLGIVEQVVDEVVGVEHRLVPARDQVGEADGPVLGEAVEVEEHGATLGQQADLARDQGRRHEQAVGGDPAAVVDEAEAVGPLEGDPAPLAVLDQGPLPLGALGAGLLVAGGEQHRARHTGRGEVVDDCRHRVAAGHHVGAVDRLADRADGGVADRAELALVARVDQVQATLVAEAAEIADDGGAPGRARWRRPARSTSG